MDDKLVLKVYELIRLNIFNPTGKNGSIAKELNEKYLLSTDDLTNTMIMKFLEGLKSGKIQIDKIKDNLKGFISVFVQNGLLDIKKSEQRRMEREEFVDEYGWGRPKY